MKKANFVLAEAGSSKILPEQEKILQDYIRDSALNGLSKATCHCKYKDLNLFARAVKKPFDKVTVEDIKNYIINISKRLNDNTLSIKKSAIK